MLKKLLKGLDSTPTAPKMGRIPLPDVEDGEGAPYVYNRTKTADFSSCLSDSESPSPARARTPGMFSRRSATPQIEPGPMPESPRAKRRPSTPRESPSSSSPSPRMPQAHAPIPRRPPPRSILSASVSSRSSTPETLSSSTSSHRSVLSSATSATSYSSSDGLALTGIRKPVRDPLHEITLHWQLLQSNPAQASKSIDFDIAHPPTEIRRLSSGKRLHLSQTDMEKPAAVPMQTEMTITYPPLPYWDIEVSCSKGISCMDVWRAIYETFNRPLTPAERELYVMSDRERKKRCQEAFEKRCERVAALPAWERKQGLKRVDLLEGVTFFKGLRIPPRTGHDGGFKPEKKWVLELGTRERQ